MILKNYKLFVRNIINYYFICKHSLSRVALLRVDFIYSSRSKPINCYGDLFVTETRSVITQKSGSLHQYLTIK